MQRGVQGTRGNRLPEKGGSGRQLRGLMKVLMKSGVYHGLATHDEQIINQAKAFAIAENIPRDAFEFQMLHGIRRDLQRSLVREGWRMRVYIPFGTEWYPYFMRRLAERPANLFFLARNLLRS